MMPRKTTILWLLGTLFSFGPTGTTLAVVTMTCTPYLPNAGVNGGDLVEVECFITSDVNQGIKGIQIDFPCTLPVPSGAEGPLTIASATHIFSRPNGSLGGTPHLAGGAGLLSPSNGTSCLIAIAPLPLSPPFQLPANTTRYAATFVYTIGECAGGEYPVSPEGVTNPPLVINGTRVRDDALGTGNLVPITVVVQQLTIDTGRCCSGSTCLGEVNRQCCLEVLGGEAWQNGATCADRCTCVSDAECDDENVCTIDQCQDTFCVHSPNALPCDDGLFCTINDTCSQGVCHGSPTPCPDGLFCNETLNGCALCGTSADCPADNNPCTDEVCGPNGDCQSVVNNAPCNDGLFCTRTDTCIGGTCVSFGNPCPENQTCDELNDRCIQCSSNAECNDNNVCTIDACVSNQCEYTNITVPCDDGLFCTLTDTCINGSCVGSGIRCPGQQCNETTNQCADCTVNAHCNDSNPCTTDSCNSLGHCVNANNTSFCDDGLFCTVVGRCTGGVCVGSINRCPPSQTCDEANDRCIQCSSNAECNDNNVCTTDTCNASGLCVHTNNTNTCNDSRFCTTTDVCSGGVCVGSGNPCPANRTCDEANDRCVQCFVNADCQESPDNICTTDKCSTQGRCVHTNNTNTCNDGRFCTVVDRCSGGVCVGSGSHCDGGFLCNEATHECVQCIVDADCNDNIECTAEICVSGTCQYTNREDPCDDGRFCTFGETCGGQVCAGGTLSPCQEGQHCNEDHDVCVECLNDAHCSDDNACTTDVCVEGECQHGNITGPCDDGMFCTSADTCIDGICVGEGAADSDEDDDGVVDCIDRCLSSDLLVNVCGCTKRGACCFPANQGCVDGKESLSSVDCQSQDGLYQGDGSTCGAGCGFADGDNDGDIDLVDFARFHACMQTDNPSDPTGKCAGFDVDRCGQIDLMDFAAFQIAYSGR
ncbi:MAG: hypothetical protein AABZ47_18695 [Planctomycetota bacterium]